MSDLRIVYMGTPDFAVYPLKCLVEGGYNVVGVVTMPDKPAGRGLKLSESAVKKYAVGAGLPLLQPVSLKDERFLHELKALNPQLGIVVAFRMLPKVVWAMPERGTFNLHASVLPDYRGAAPINWALINGDTETGVTTFMLDEQIDTGDIIEVRKVPITEEDNAGTLHDKLMYAGGELVLHSVDRIEQGKLTLHKQPDISEKMRPAPKIFKDTCKIDWNNDIVAVKNLIRGLSPYPAAWTDFDGKYSAVSLKIFAVKTEFCSHGLICGEVVTDGRHALKVACNGGFIHILELQLSGKKRMDTEAFLRGNRMFDK